MTIEEIKKSIQCCYDRECANCPNNDELGSGEIVCIYRLLPKIESCINELHQQLVEKDEQIKELESELNFKNNIIWAENDSAILCGDCYCLNNDVRKLVEENQQVKQQLAEKDEQIAKLSEDLIYEKNFRGENTQHVNNLIEQVSNENKRLKTQMSMIRTNQMVEELELIKQNLNKLNPQLYTVDEYKEEVVRQIDFEIKKFKDIDRAQSGLKRI